MELSWVCVGNKVNSFLKQSIPKEDFEVIVVDDGSTDNTISMLSKMKDDKTLNISIASQDHKGPGEARNYGMALAKGKYFVFIDSDCIADTNWLLSYKEEVEKKAEEAASGLASLFG